MRLFRVDFQDNVRPPILLRGLTRAQVSRQMKERYGDLFLRVDYISHEDAEAQFGHFDLFKNVKENLVPEFNKYTDTKSKDNIMFKDQFKLAEISKNKIYNYLDKSGQEPGHEKDMESASAKRDKGFTNATNKVLGKAKVNATEEYADFITPETELTEEMYFKVNIQGLPDMYMSASSAGMIKAKLRKMLKNMDMIGDIVKTPKADVRKAFRMKAMEGEDTQDESTITEVKDGPPDKKLSPNTRALAQASDKRSRSTIIKAMNINAPKDKALQGGSYQEGKDVTQGYMDHMKKVNKGEVNKYPMRGKGKPLSQARKDALFGKKKKENNVSEDFIENKSKFGKPTKASEDVFEHEANPDQSNTVNFTSILTGDNPFYKPIQELSRNTLSSYSQKANDRLDNAPDKKAIGIPTPNNVRKYGNKLMNKISGQRTAQNKVAKADGADQPHKYIGGKKSNIKIAANEGNIEYPTMTSGGAFAKIANEGHDEIQDKNVNGLDDNQKPEGKKTAKQFPAPKDAKSKMKSLKMEMKTDIADLVIEKAKLKKNDMKMRAGKLDIKAMTALKTMSQDEAKVLVQGLPSNLRKSTMKELGIKEQDSKPSYKKTVESILLKREAARKVEEDSMSDQQDQATKTYNANKKSLTSLHRKAKRGGQVHVDHTDEKGKKQSGRYNGMMRMGAHTYAKIEPHDGKKGGTTLLPIHQAQNIRHVK